MKHWRRWKYRAKWMNDFGGWKEFYKSAFDDRRIMMCVANVLLLLVIQSVMLAFRVFGVRFWLKKGKPIYVGGDWGLAKAVANSVNQEQFVEAL
jgi:hypothetical protein